MIQHVVSTTTWYDVSISTDNQGRPEREHRAMAWTGTTQKRHRHNETTTDHGPCGRGNADIAQLLACADIRREYERRVFDAGCTQLGRIHRPKFAHAMTRSEKRRLQQLMSTDDIPHTGRPAAAIQVGAVFVQDAARTCHTRTMQEWDCFEQQRPGVHRLYCFSLLSFEDGWSIGMASPHGSSHHPRSLPCSESLHMNAMSIVLFCT